MTSKLVWFQFTQNNSGGTFHRDKNVSDYVLIQAMNADEANQIAENIGIYFDGAGDCPCCGNRWSSVWSDNDGTDEPTIYGQNLVDYSKGRSRSGRGTPLDDLRIYPYGTVFAVSANLFINTPKQITE